MKKLGFLLLTVFLFFGIRLAFSQESETEEYLNLKPEIDGYFWVVSDFNFKFGYVMGVFHGFLHTAGYYTTIVSQSGLVKEQSIRDWIENLTDILYFGSSPRDMIAGLNEFYKDDLNKKIPVHRLMTVVCKKVDGVLNPEEVDIELQKLRSEARKKK